MYCEIAIEDSKENYRITLTSDEIAANISPTKHVLIRHIK